MPKMIAATLEFPSGPTPLLVETGTVTGVRVISDTHVSGYVAQGLGRVSSEVVHTTRFGLVGGEGIELDHHYSGSNFVIGTVTP